MTLRIFVHHGLKATHNSHTTPRYNFSLKTAGNLRSKNTTKSHLDFSPQILIVDHLPPFIARDF